MKLLVVDDQGAVGAIISRIAQQGGWEAINVTSASGLAEIVRSKGVNVMLLDYLMEANEQRTGLTVLEELRKAGIDIPVILFSGATHLIDRAKAAELGVACILDKPLSIQELRVSLNDAKKKFLDDHPAAS